MPAMSKPQAMKGIILLSASKLFWAHFSEEVEEIVF